MLRQLAGVHIKVPNKNRKRWKHFRLEFGSTEYFKHSGRNVIYSLVSRSHQAKVDPNLSRGHRDHANLCILRF